MLVIAITAPLIAAPLVSSTRPASVAAEIVCCANAGSIPPVLMISSAAAASDCLTLHDCMILLLDFQKDCDWQALLLNYAIPAAAKWPDARCSILRVIR